MRGRYTGLLVLAVMASGLAAAQDGSVTPLARSRAVQNTRSGPITLTGCLQSNRGVHTLLRQDTSQAFILTGDAQQFAANSGHQVRVEASELPPEGTQPPQNLPRLQVRRFEVLSGDCATNVAPAAPTGAARGGQQGTAETSPYNAPGSMAKTPAPVGPGTGQQINGRAEGAPSPGSGDPRNLSPSPQDVPIDASQPDTGKTTKSGKKSGSKQPNEPVKNPPQ